MRLVVNFHFILQLGMRNYLISEQTRLKYKDSENKFPVIDLVKAVSYK